jgi:hypothetical protein
MVMRPAYNLFLVLALASCGGGSTKKSEDLGTPDLAVTVDMAGGAIGSTCSSNDDCHDGTAPTCFIATLFNESGKLKTPSGYCSASCTMDADCGAAGACRTFSGESHGWCFAACSSPDDCRASYACFTGTTPYCFPSANLDCDPTAPGGTCDDAQLSNPGGCIRAALGTGTVGYCNDGCTVGAGSCPPSGGENRECVVYNQTGDKDPNGALEGDTFHGAICNDAYAQNADGAECVSNGKDYIDACVDGEECWLTSAFHGDNRCHKLCTGNFDAGDECPAGESCQDVFGLLASANPTGLCH